MRTTISTIVFLILTTLLFGQSSNKVELIRKMVEQIDKDTTYSTKTKTLNNEQFLEHMTDAGGLLTGYFKNGQLVKVSEKIELSSCVANYEYYYQDSFLIFVSGRERVFAYVDSTNSFDSTREVPGWGCTYYLYKGNLVKSIQGGHSRCFSPPKNPPQVSDIFKKAKKYSELLKQ